MGKKLAAVVLCAALCLTALAGCGTAQEELQNVTLYDIDSFKIDAVRGDALYFLCAAVCGHGIGLF